ncbi:MAG: AAA family ATPase, partial [Actinomycetota bacterium]|nr:AAA family ATPase [Actinomycetota bacterium]
ANSVILTRPPGYVLLARPEQLDLECFKRLSAEGRDALAGGDAAAAARKLRDALDLWRGRPLADLSDEEFAEREAARLEELRVAALEDRVAADLELGRHGEVVAELEKLVADDPLRERPRAQLMLALYRSGRQADALSVFAAARRVLVEELGIEPGRELRELQTAILEHDPALDPPAAPARVRPPEVHSPSATLVGRQSEVAAFSEALDGAFQGRLSVFTLSGEPGIGKSRLADELAAVASHRGAKVCWGRCWEAGGAPAYWPWVQVLRACIGDADAETVRRRLGPGAADVAHILPELHDLYPAIPHPPTQDPEGARFRLFDSTATFLRRTGEACPHVLVFDDLHAADEPSLLLLRFVARSLRDARLVVVAAYRDTELPRAEALADAVGELRREPAWRPLHLEGLGPGEVARVVELIGGSQPEPALADAIHRRTEGNPLFVAELVRLLAAEGGLDRMTAAVWRPNVPQGVREVIAHRLRHLSEGCKDALEVASVLGREFDVDAVARVSGCARADVLDLLDEAERAGVVLTSTDRLDAYRFSHGLVRDGVYGGLTTGERRKLHRRALEVLEDLFASTRDEHLAELAHHALEAAPEGDAQTAVEYARLAAEQAGTLLAYEEAARLYRMALDAAALAPDADERVCCELLLGLGESQAKGGDLLAAKDAFLRAAEMARTAGADELLARAALGYGGRYVWFRAGNDDRLVPLLEDALARSEGDHPLRARLLARLAGALRDRADLERRAALSREAVEIARRLGDPSTLAYALDGTYAALSWPRDAEAWLEMARELTQLADDAGDKEQAFSSRLHAFGAYMVRGDVAAADAELGRMVALAQELRQPTHAWSLSIAKGTRALFAGRIAEADRLLTQFADVGPGGQGSDASDYDYVLCLQAWAVRREQGRLEEVEPMLARAVVDYPALPVFRWLSISVDAALGRTAGARREIDRMVGQGFAELGVATEWFFGAALLAEASTIVGHTACAERLYQMLRPYGDFNVCAHPEAALGAAARPLGLLAGTLGRWDDAERHFVRASEMNARMGSPLWVAHTEHDHALIVTRRGGNVRAAAALFRSARDRYEALGMTWWRDRAAAGERALDA